MLSSIRQKAFQNLQPLAARSIASVVSKADIQVTDFKVQNEPVLGYLPGSQERTAIEAALQKYNNSTEDVPIVIGGKEYRTDDVRYQPMPHNHQKKVAKFYYATPELVTKAIETSLEAKKEWEKVPLDERMKLFLRVADEMAGKYRADLNATTMLGQAKTVIQVSIYKKYLCYLRHDGRLKVLTPIGISKEK